MPVVIMLLLVILRTRLTALLSTAISLWTMRDLLMMWRAHQNLDIPTFSSSF